MYVFKQRKYQKDFTPLLNETITRPKHMISDSAFRVHMVLLSTSPAFNPNEKWLAKTLGKSVSSVYRDIKELKGLGLLRIEQKWEDKEGKYRTKWMVSEKPCDRWLESETKGRPPKPT